MTSSFGIFFFFNDTATTEIYTLSLHDALPIWAGGEAAVTLMAQQPLPRLQVGAQARGRGLGQVERGCDVHEAWRGLGLGHEIDRKSTRLNSSHGYISYAVFCLTKKT